MTITVGNFVLNGFVAGLFAPTMDGVATDDFVFNWGGADTAGNNAGGQTVLVSGASGDHWSLTVTLSAVGGTGETLFSGGLSASVGNSIIRHGTGDASLQSFIQSLHVVTPNGPPDSYTISFNLTDDTAAGNSSWSQSFANSVACYATGTRIAVPGGETAIEDLRIGDLVMTASGSAKQVKWLGRRSYTAAETAANPHVRSVLVRKNAIAPGMPHRDLSVSAMHSLFIDDAFVPAAALVNGVTILRNDELAAVSYVHIEMDGHDVVFAEGQPAETYIDDASRQMFDNADEYYAVYGAEQGATAFSAPRIEEGFQLEALRRRLAARAGIAATAASTGTLRGHVERLEDGVMHGWVFDASAPGSAVELEILVDGEVVATAIANRYRADLDHAGMAGGRAGFTVALPASVTSLRQVAVRRTADGAKVAVPQIAMAD